MVGLSYIAAEKTCSTVVDENCNSVVIHSCQASVVLLALNFHKNYHLSSLLQLTARQSPL